MKIAFLRRLRPPLYVWPLLILGVILSQSTYAQGDPPTQRSLRQEPSNERTGIRKKVSYTWGCYNSKGKWQECQFEQSVEGLKQPENCLFDPDGGATLCTNGGHFHNGIRPLVFDQFTRTGAPSNGKLLFPADQDGDPLRVKGITNATGSWATTVHELPQAGGRLQAKGQMQFFGGGFGRPRFDRNTKQSEMTIDVRIPGLKRLPDPTPFIGDPLPPASSLYEKRRNGPGGINTDMVHPNSVAYSGTPFTVQTVPLIAEWYFSYSGRILSVNDISLPKGGVFNTSFTNPMWFSPHKEHRDGADVDLNLIDPLSGVDLECLPDHALRFSVDQLVEPVIERADDPQNLGRLTALLCESGGRKHIDMAPFGG